MQANVNATQPVYHLIAVLDDAKRGYLNAAEKIKDEVLSLLFERFGYQRGKYSTELKHLVNRLGQSCPVDQLALSLLHRTWMDLKTSFKFGKREEIIKACIKGEEKALQDYTEAIAQVQHNDEVKMILQHQANGIKTVLNTIKEYTARSIK